jgi:DNA-binding NtrC family response regulator
MTNELSDKGGVLIIEDDLDTKDVLVEMLGSKGYCVHAVENRDQALQFLEDKKFGTIIMDLFMPGMSAEVFLQQIPETRPRCLILYTAAPDAAHEARRLKIKNYLQKPLSEEAILLAVRRCVLNPQ